MKNGYILWNPLSGGGLDQESISRLESLLGVTLKAKHITEVADYAELFRQIDPDDVLVVAGGDGTLNHFINDTDGLEAPFEILYYPCGTGNDFARDLGKDRLSQPFSLKRWMDHLPTVEVKGKTYRFLNGVGFGIDGYCCEIGDELRKIPGKKVNYTAIAIKGLLYDYSPTSAVVTVDGVRHEFRKVWIAPTMFGRYYGGGMMPTPEQDRACDTISTMIFHDSGKLRTLMIFPSLFKGTHVKHSKYVQTLAGREITVEFSEPRPLQIDGETILNVRSYTARR